MTQAEIMELINIKRNMLEQHRAANPADTSAVVKILENEIKELETSLAKASPAPKRSEKKVFLDECAG
ncbi:MAG: hypothetical protein HY667_04160 [Chloroflexi bacterium]|nr:hypothetical protein [Chloroflexota bacterium]